MRSIPLLNVDPIAVFNDIATAKHPPRRARMRAARAEVLAAYQRYEDALPEVGALVAIGLTDAQKEAMQHAYAVETLPMTELRGNLLKGLSSLAVHFAALASRRHSIIICRRRSTQSFLFFRGISCRAVRCATLAKRTEFSRTALT